MMFSVFLEHTRINSVLYNLIDILDILNNFSVTFYVINL